MQSGPGLVKNDAIVRALTGTAGSELQTISSPSTMPGDAGSEARQMRLRPAALADSSAASAAAKACVKVVVAGTSAMPAEAVRQTGFSNVPKLLASNARQQRQDLGLGFRRRAAGGEHDELGAIGAIDIAEVAEFLGDHTGGADQNAVANHVTVAFVHRFETVERKKDQEMASLQHGIVVNGQRGAVPEAGEAVGKALLVQFCLGAMMIEARRPDVDPDRIGGQGHDDHGDYPAAQQTEPAMEGDQLRGGIDRQGDDETDRGEAEGKDPDVTFGLDGPVKERPQDLTIHCRSSKPLNEAKPSSFNSIGGM